MTFQRQGSGRRKSRVGKIRRGGPAVECAFCLPLVLIFMFGTLEICSAIFLKESLTIACYEGARSGVKRRATNQDSVDRAEEIIAARGVTGAIIQVTPEDFSTLSALDEITVTITAPAEGNLFFINQFMPGKHVSSTVVMVREFDE